MKICRTCNVSKPEDQFHKDRSKADGLNAYCKPCTIARQKEFAKRPPRKADPAPAGMKTCQRCKTAKPVSEYHASPARHDGLDRRCKTCAFELHENWRLNNLGYVAAEQKKHRDANPERHKDYGRKSMYGLDPGQFDRMLQEQDGRCAICGTEEPGGRGGFHVDHSHYTGKVRAILCNNCNTGIGKFKEDTGLLTKAIRYLDKRKT
jgi:hypothetical protein